MAQNYLQLKMQSNKQLAFEVVFLSGSCVAYCYWNISVCTVYTGACCFTQRSLGDCYFCYICEIQ